MTTRFLILSDTHATDYTPPDQHADVALHCSDLTQESKIDEFRATIGLLKGLNAPLKLVIAGNHDFTLDVPMFREKVAEMAGPVDPELVKSVYGDYGEARRLLKEAREHGIILLDEGLYTFDLANGSSLTIYASPFTPSEGGWGFQYSPRQGHGFDIEDRVDIVMTHGPPHGVMDRPYSSSRVGCPDLFKAVFQARPKLHCFGHIHEEWGAKLVTWRDNDNMDASHLTVIENDPGKSPVITNLSRLGGSKYDEPEAREAKLEKLKTSQREGCYSTRCSAEPGTQTLFINASIMGDQDQHFHLPWLDLAAV
ncbi:metallophosphoesterase domain-containing protein 2 [Nannizzia gypsea CBS 118893]|uniref:Metallophosphoesterase domain-containing protein 2 n=1 Tax=Arthroderma gypseum (strain ATCC MYA-4604 / CBS 118893) TaxID=535722 RepID=E5QYY0_ARTGP|nr:metallophosphoesterase domain-containing protein 2 [Nannizzia gypsea CBS 118893]EFQ98103.1 metallophosphoesterase domain-containing protein 2 [Nannizzia gypsea CBS 118893]